MPTLISRPRTHQPTTTAADCAVVFFEMTAIPMTRTASDHRPKMSKKLQRRPWQYFRDHFFVTFWFESVAPKLLLETIGEDNVLFETDFPHPTSLYPGVQEHIVDVLGAYSPETRKKVLQSNAAKLYNLPF